MRVLLTNDDGVTSTGLMAAYEALSGLADVTVVAPATQQSAVGRSISIFQPIRIFETRVDGVDMFSVGGTPTDAVVLGLHRVMDERPDLVVCGINMGENLSTESVTTSGTVGAALEASTQGVPSLAVSVQVEESEKFHHGQLELELEHAKDVLRSIVEPLGDGFPEGVDLLNLNVPTPCSDDTPVRVTRLARRFFDTEVVERRDPRGNPYYWIDGDHVKDAEPGTDVHTVLAEEQVSLTPISLDSTSPDPSAVHNLLEGMALRREDTAWT
ncbi:MAG: 5'-nucleotidase SurE1 [Methanonatronarchaeales archaeon]|nr:5'-nucleotidase SurE1 [Methanonatronarchaeales archaeon]